MSSIRQWVVQVRYPYTAGVIAISWLGTALFLLIVPGMPVVIVVSALAVVTLVISFIGFSSPVR